MKLKDLESWLTPTDAARLLTESGNRISRQAIEKRLNEGKHRAEDPPGMVDRPRERRGLAEERESHEGGREVRAALYVRVSTDEQAKSGYSIPDQLRELQHHAHSNGYKIVDTLKDDGYSGADSTRPGMMKAMELAESGVIDVVLATKRDRLFRSRLQRLLMDQSLGEYSVKLVALNNTGHRIGDGVQDDYAEWEREIFTERSRAGKRQKAREGKIIAHTRPPFGFAYNARRTNFAVDGTTMPVVRRMFELIGKEGSSLRKVRTTLDKEGVPTPSGSPFWNPPSQSGASS